MIFGRKKTKPTGGILLVEDNLFMAELLRQKLLRSNFAVRVAHDGAQALEQFESSPPQMLILDAPLAGDIDSFEIVSNVRKKYDRHDIPIIILFGFADQTTADQAMVLGASAYLLKTRTNTDEIVSLAQHLFENPDTVVKGSLDVESQSDEPLSVPIEVEGDHADTKTDLSAEQVEALMQKVRNRIQEALKMKEDEAPIIALVEDMIEYAYLIRASDIHFEPRQDKMILRMRVDGILNDTFTVPKKLHPGVITRIKVLGGIRTDEHQAALDGRFRIINKETYSEFDIRVSIVPTYHGENCVLRLLAEQADVTRIEDLSFSAADMEKIKRAVARPHGMILATGPTGSGKSTTLYTILKEISTRAISIITIEDPVEYSLEGIDQIQVNNRSGLTFANGLRSILRQDPNVIMVGEIRDEETASIAVNAALTGHKLLSTLHTNDAATTLPRLLDMGVEPFLVASTINVAIGQRLVRVLCQSCKIEKTLTEAERQNILKYVSASVLSGDKSFFQAAGCDVCHNTGYKGRMGIYEVLEVNDFIRDAIIQHADAAEIKKIAIKNGMTTLIEDGFDKVTRGLTTVEEILRVVRE